MRSKVDMSQLYLPHGNRQLKSENGYAQKYRQTVRGIRGVSPEEEKEGYGWKDLQKTNVLSLE